MTVAEALPLPPTPLQPSEKVLSADSAPVDWLPEVALAPDQAPEAVHEVALVDDHVSVDAAPLATETGFAARDTLGGGTTAIVVDALPVPPAPLQLSEKVLLTDSAPVDWLPEVALAPDQAPEAVHEVALVDDHVSVDEAPFATAVGLEARDTVGTGGGGEAVTVTSTVALALPPVPVQVTEKVLLAVSAPVDWLPEVALAPDHAPDAVHAVASVDDQLSVDEVPLATEVGLALKDTVGAGGGGGDPVTATCADAFALPRGPEQVMEYVLLAVSAPVDSLPEVVFVPDHAPEATHVVASVDDHVSIDATPLLIDAGLAERETFGAS